MMLMFRRHRTDLPIEVGGQFICEHVRSSLVEMAEVLAVGEDRLGIPHVRFRLSYLIANRAEEQGTRTLALSAFSQHFQQAPTAPALSPIPA